jgi:hypothetical protein
MKLFSESLNLLKKSNKKKPKKKTPKPCQMVSELDVFGGI